MPKTINVEGIGPVDFPDEATDDDILTGLNDIAPVKTQPAKSSEFDYLPQLPPITEEKLTAAEKPLSWQAPAVDLIAPEEAFGGIPRIPSFGKEGSALHTATEFAGGLEESVLGGLSGMTSREGMITLPAFAVPYVGPALALGLGAKAIGSGAGQTVAGIELGQPRVAGAGVGEGLIGGLMISGGAKGAAPEIRFPNSLKALREELVVEAPKTVVEEPLSKEVPGAIQEQIPSGVFPSLQTQPVKGEQALSAAEGTSRIRGSEQAAKEPEIPLTPKSGDPLAETPNPEAALFHGPPDRFSSDAKVFSDLIESEPFRTQGFSGLDVPSQRVVQDVVLRMAHDSKVFDSVVQLVPVDVMHNLITRELAPKVNLHDAAVLADLDVRFREAAVSLGGKTSFSSPSSTASVAAKEGAVGSDTLSKEGITAVRAGEGGGHAQIVAKPTEATSETGKNISVGPGAASPSEFKPEKPFVTGAANAVTAEKRDTLGLPAAREEAARKWGTVWEDVKQQVADDPGAGQRLVNELNAKPRPVSDREIALLDHEMIGLEETKNKVVRQMLDAAETGGDTAIPEYRAHLNLIRDQLQAVYDASKVAGREQARAFNIRKMLVNENYTLVKMEMEKRAENEGRPLTEEQLAEVKALHDKIADAQKKYDEYVAKSEAKIRELEAQRAVAELKAAAAREQREDAASGTVRDLDAEHDNIVAGIRNQTNKPLRDLRPWIRKLALNFVRSGIAERNDLVNAVHGVVKDIVPNITVRDTMDAISGYGDFRPLDADAAKAKLRDLSGQMQNVAKLEDLLARRAIKKTGPERKVPSDEERRLAKLVNEYKRRYGVTVTDPATQLKSSLAAIKTRLTHQIADLEFQIQTGKKIVKGETKVQYDAEAKALVERRDALKAQFDDIFGKPELTDEQRIAMAKRGLESSIVELNRRIAAGETRTAKTPSKTPVTAELQVLRDQREALRSQLQALKDSDVLLQEERAVADLQSTIADLERRLAEGDLFEQKRSQAAATAITAPLLERKTALQEELAQRKAASPEGMARAHEQRIAALEKAIAENERRLREGDLSRLPPRVRSVEEQALSDRNAELSRQLAELRRQSPEGLARAEAKRIEAIEDEIKDLESKIARGDLSKTGKPARERSEAEKGRREVLGQTRNILKEMRERSGMYDSERISKAEKALDEMIAETMRQINEGDIAVKSVPSRITSPELELKRGELGDLRRIRQQLRNAAKPKKTPEEIALASLKTRLRNQTADLRERLARGDFSGRVHKPVAMDAEALELQRQHDLAKAEFDKSLEKDRYAKLSTPRKILQRSGEAYDAVRSILTSFDLSAVLRQGKFIVMAHPIRGAKAIPDMMRALASAKESYRIDKEILDRPNYPIYKQSGLYLADHGAPLAKMEEAYMSTLADRIPGVKQSQRAYNTFLNKLRADSFDAMAESLSRHRPITPIEAETLSNFINAATGRGSLGSNASALVGLNRVFFSPRYVASRFQLLLGQPLYKGTARTRALIASEYARTLIGYAVAYTLAKMALPDSEIETDPRSSDAGKIVIGNTRIDPLAGLQQVTVLLSRLASGETMDLGGRINPIRGEEVPYGGAKVPDILARFLRSKLAPIPGAVVNLVAGQDVVGQPVTPTSTVTSLTVPLAYSDILKAIEDQGVPRGVALAILSIFGEGVQVYDEGR